MSYLLDYNPGTQQWGYPRRGASLSGTCILHTAECAADNIGDDTSAEGCASMIANRADWGSYHRLVDSDSIIDMLPFEYEAWQDSETNPWAVGISAALRTSDWLNMPADREDRVYKNLAICAAEFVRHMAAKGITVPLVRISGAQARARVPGFCAHGDSGIARSDPGANFDWAKFFRYTAAALGGGLTYQGSTITPPEEDVPNTQLELQEAALKVISVNKTVIGGRSLVQGVNQALLGIDVVNDNIAQLKTFVAQQIAPAAGVKDDSSTYYLKGDKAPEVYALDIATGKLRHVQSAEFDVVNAIGIYKTVEQAKVDALLKGN